MKITNLKLANFRNYSFLDIDFFNNKNIIYGKNGSGKTNLIEAIYILAFTKSFRGTTDKIIIKSGSNISRITGLIEKNKYEFNYNNECKSLKINNKKIDKFSDYISNINVILFNPDDLKIIKDSPSERRKYLNMEISQIDNNYLKELNNYNKLIKQRNNYLKKMYINKNISYDYLDILTNKIIEKGMFLCKKRSEYIENININFKKIYKKITSIDDVNIKYKSDYLNKDKNILYKKYKMLYERDIVLGKTSYGIHHDDFSIIMNNFDIKDYGSEGQQKNAIISLKLSELELIKHKKGSFPILILDDLFSELDKYKINNIFKYLKKSVQTFITVTDVDKINEKYLIDASLFRVKNNRVEEIKNGKSLF